MAITTRQRANRSRGIGASEVPAILGLSPWTTAWDVWASKRGLLEPREPNAAMQAGTILERSILDWAEQVLGPLRRNQYRSCPDHYMFAHLDAITSGGIPVEAKTSRLFGSSIDDWGSEDSDEIPEHVIVQVHAQMICSHADMAHVVAFIGGAGFRRYEIRFDSGLARIIVDTCTSWWRRHVIVGIEPTCAPSLEVAKRLKRTPRKVVELDGEWLAVLDDAQAKAKQAAERVEEVKAGILAAMGDAEGVIFRGTGKMLDYRERTSHYRAQEARDVVARKWIIKSIKETVNDAGTIDHPKIGHRDDGGDPGNRAGEGTADTPGDGAQASEERPGGQR